MPLQNMLNNISIGHYINKTNYHKNDLNIIYINKGSLRNKIEQLETLIHTHSLIHLIILTETWLNEHETPPLQPPKL